MINSNTVKFSLAAFVGGLLLAACGDNVTKVTNVMQETSGLEVVASADSLGKCTEEISGEMKFVSKENAVYVCADSAWKNVSAAGKDGSDGKSCTVEMLADSLGYKIVCDGDSVGVIFNGKDGLDGKDGIDGADGEMGEAGKDGKDGSDGAKGEDGKDGKNGEGCSLTDNGDGTVTQDCGADSVILYKAFCGGKSFDPDSSFCYGNTIYTLCNGKIYNPQNETCENGIVYGSVIDIRDNQIYKTIQIGSQVWMAENLNYAYPKLAHSESEDDSTESVVLDSISFCYNNDPANCEKYGRLYTWAAAMDSLTTGCGYNADCFLAYPVRGSCPEGWHLPDTTDWNVLSSFVAKQIGGSDSVGYALKSTSGWERNGNGSDAFGFGALPAGSLFENGPFLEIFGIAGFWTSTEFDAKHAYSRLLTSSRIDLYLHDTIVLRARSVRCVKD